jgi:transketolase
VLRHSFAGRNLHFGVREHAMGAIINGLVIEGLRAYGATFLAFSEYMREPIRLAALMEIPSIFVFTHDSIWLGEDGPTHQPIEQLISLRAIPNLDVIRPADYRETFLAWHWLLASASVPTALALTRQKLPVLEPGQVPDDAIERGAYVYSETEGNPRVILIGTGSEVSLCIAAADLLAKEGIGTRVVSMPCFERFADQPQDYRDEVLPPDVRARLSVEAGSPLGWRRWIGEKGASVALERFGASAPGPVVAEHLGFTAENVAKRARELVS